MGRKGYSFEVKEFVRNQSSKLSCKEIQQKIFEKFGENLSEVTIWGWRKVSNTQIYMPVPEGSILDQYETLKKEIKRAEEFVESLKQQERSTIYAIRAMRIRLAQLRRENEPR